MMHVEKVIAVWSVCMWRRASVLEMVSCKDLGSSENGAGSCNASLFHGKENLYWEMEAERNTADGDDLTLFMAHGSFP